MLFSVRSEGERKKRKMELSVSGTHVRAIAVCKILCVPNNNGRFCWVNAELQTGPSATGTSAVCVLYCFVSFKIPKEKVRLLKWEDGKGEFHNIIEENYGAFVVIDGTKVFLIPHLFSVSASLAQTLRLTLEQPPVVAKSPH